MKIKDSPWSKVQILCANTVLLADDSHFAIYNHKTNKLKTSFDELIPFKSDVCAVFLTRNAKFVLIVLKNSRIIVFDTSNKVLTRQYSNLPRILKEELVDTGD